MIISLIKSKFFLKEFQKEQIFMRWVLLNIEIVYQNFISGNLLIYKLVHTFRGNRYLK